MLFFKKAKFSMLLVSLIIITNLFANLVAYAMVTDEVIVDDKDSGFYRYGDVSTNSGTDGKWVSNNYTPTNYNGVHWWSNGANGEYATYTPNLKGGVYEIYSYVPISNSASSKSMAVEIYGSAARATTEYSIWSSGSVVVPTGFLKLSGTYTFEPGTNGYVNIYNANTAYIGRIDAVKFVKVADVNSAGVSNKNILVSDDIKISFAAEQASSILPKVSLIDTQTGSTIPSSITLDTGSLGVTINPTTNLDSGKFYTVIIDDNTLIGAKKWTVKTEDTVLEKLVINNKGDGVTSADSNGTYIESGTWEFSGLTGINEPYHANAGISNQTRNAKDAGIVGATYTPTIVNAGYYKISVFKFYTDDAGTAINGPIDSTTEIKGADGTVSFNKSYAMRLSGTTYIKEWESVGVYKFDAGTTGYFKISKRLANSNLRTDAVKFERIAVDTALPTVLVKNSNTNAVTLQFNKVMDISNMDYRTLSLKEKNTGTLISTSIVPQNDGKTVKLIPASALTAGTQYTVAISDKIIDFAGNKASGNLIYYITAGEAFFTISNVTTVGDIVANGNVSAVITATNKFDVDEVANGIIGVYKGNKLVDVKWGEISISSGSENTQFTINHTLKSDLEAGATLKAFVWKDLDNLKPLK